MKRETKHIGRIVDSILNKIEQKNVKKGNAVNKAFAKAVDEEIKKYAKPVSLKNGTLIVVVENSSWLYKLTLEKREMLRKFNEEYTGRKKPKDIRFRVGIREE